MGLPRALRPLWLWWGIGGAVVIGGLLLPSGKGVAGALVGFLIGALIG